MTWILTLWLLSGLSGPLYLTEREPCELVVARLAQGEPVFVELADGTTDLVIRAECIEERAS